jgi:hypothetical protein
MNYGDVYTTTGTTGIFDVVSNVPDGLMPGTYVVTAVDASGKNSSTSFTLYGVFSDSGSFGIKNPKQYVQWKYDSRSFYCTTWKIFHNSQNNWYNVMVDDYGLYTLRLTYNGTTYIFDLANGAFNAWPVALQERVVGVTILDPSHVQGKILISDPTGSVLLATILVDVYAPGPLESYYSVVFNVTSEVKLTDVAVYAAFNLNLYQPPNSALYDRDTDSVYQYYGPSHYGSNIPEQYKAVAGFGSIAPSSTHHDLDIDFNKVLSVANNLRDFDFNYRDRDEVHADAFGNVATGLQWVIGMMNAKQNVTIPMVFAAADTTVEAFKDSLTKGKLSLKQSISGVPSISLAASEGPGTSIIGVSGVGFMPNSQIALTFGGVSVGSFGANSLGAFAGNFLVPTSITGNYSVVATDGYGLTASANFKVVELTLQWLMNKLDQFNATITSLIKDGNGNLGALISTGGGNILASMDEINATLTGLIGDNQNVTLATIDTALGVITAKVDQIDARIVEIVGNAKGDVLARIDSRVGQILVKVDAINASIVDIVGDAKSGVLARIDTKVGEALVKLETINATIVEIVGNAKGDVLARIDTKVGEILVKVDKINATIVDVVGDAKSGVLARIDTQIGQALVKLETINASLVDIIGDAKSGVLARIDTKVGEALVKLGVINATFVDIVGDAKSGVLARIDSKVGDALVKIDAINGHISNIEGNLVTISSDVGNIKVSLSDIGAKVTKINSTVAIIETSMGTLIGNVTSIQGDLATIKTDLGTLVLATKPLQSGIDVQPFNILAIVEIVAISAIIYTIYSLRTRRKRLQSPERETVFAETPI